MNLPAIVTVSATIPFFAAAISDEAQSGKEDLMAVFYVAAAGLLLSCAALVDDMFALTSWFGLLSPDAAGLF